jgi:hypothetical protein
MDCANMNGMAKEVQNYYSGPILDIEDELQVIYLMNCQRFQHRLKNLIQKQIRPVIHPVFG